MEASGLRRRAAHRFGRAALLALTTMTSGSARAQVNELPWIGPAPPGWRDAAELVLEGVLDEQGRFVAKALTLPEPSGADGLALLPIGPNFLSLLDVRIFGVDERVRLQRDEEGLRLSCSAGARAAGAVLRWPGYRLPRAMEAKLMLTGEAGAGFGLSAVLPGGDAPVQSTARFEAGTAVLALPTEPAELVITCPARAAELLLRDVRIVPAAVSRGSYGSWAWDSVPALGAPERFAVRLALHGLNEIAVQAPPDATRSLAPLAKALRIKGIALRLVEGDPGMTDAAGLARAVVRVAALRIAARSDPGAVLELDIEPYTMPGYSTDPSGAWRRWGEAVVALARAWGRPVDIVVPWWMLGRASTDPALKAADDAIGGVVVMAYRTDPQLILAAAEPWLAWGAAHGKPVRVAIETGRVAAEVQRRYRRAETGALEIAGDLAQIGGSTALNDAGAARFALVRETRTDPGRVSFHGADEVRLAVEAQLLPVLRAWPSFAGSRAHGLDLE